MMDRWFVERLAECFEQHPTAVTMDDITDCGRLAVDSDHGINGRQNKLGSWMRLAKANGWVVDTGRTVLTRAPHGKGRKITVWAATEKGLRWADYVLNAGQP